LLGAVQGVTEWLPISSSGHLAIVQHFLGVGEAVALDVALHIASLLVVLVVFWKDIHWLLVGILRREPKALKMFLLLCIATVPAALAGVFLGDFIDSAFSDLRIVGYGLLLTSALLYLSRYPIVNHEKMTFASSVAIGAIQALAILPGVSRSGCTISSALLLGIDREEAARFSFLLFIPLVLGATVLKLPGIAGLDLLPTLAGMMTAIVTGFVSMRLLIRIIKKNMFYAFSAYCFLLGIFLLFI